MHSFSVKVVYPDGAPVADTKVFASEAGFLGESGFEYTDSDGWVTFENPYWSDEKTVYGVMIYVEGGEYGPYDIENGDTISIAISLE